MKLIITGHRPQKTGGYSIPVLKAMVTFAMDTIRELRPTVVISGMALGWDMACAIATIKLREEEQLGIELHAFVPFDSQSSTWKDEKLIGMYKKCLEKADQVLIVHPGEPKDRTEAAQWLQERNVAMVDYGDKVLALHNGTRGGTYNCIQYAVKMGRPVRNVWPKWAPIMKPFLPPTK